MAPEARMRRRECAPTGPRGGQTSAGSLRFDRNGRAFVSKHLKVRRRPAGRTLPRCPLRDHQLAPPTHRPPRRAAGLRCRGRKFPHYRTLARAPAPGAPREVAPAARRKLPGAHPARRRNVCDMCASSAKPVLAEMYFSGRAVHRSRSRAASIRMSVRACIGLCPLAFLKARAKIGWGHGDCAP